MNSLVCVDKNEQRSRFSVLGDREEENEEDPLALDGANTSTSTTGGSVVLVLPKENVVESVDISQECIPIMVDNVPVYLSQTDNKPPLYIRQYPPSVEELFLDESSKPSPTFDGFSEASGSTFDGFSEASYCSAIAFEGFDDRKEDIDLAGVSEETVKEGSVKPSPDEASKELGKGEKLLSEKRGGKADVHSHSEGSSNLKNNATPAGRARTRSVSFDSVVKSPVDSSTPRKLSLSSRRAARHSSSELEGRHLENSNELPATLKRVSSSKEAVSRKKHKPGEGPENEFETTGSEIPEIKVEVESPRKTRCSFDTEDEGSGVQVLTRKRGRRRTTELEVDEDPAEVGADNSDGFIGKLCSSVGCTIQFLESMKVKNVFVCNGIVYELSEFAVKIAWDRTDVARWIQRLSGVRDGNPTVDDLDKIHIVLKRRKALKVTLAGQKIGSMKLKAFDLTEFFLPSCVDGKEEREIKPVTDQEEKDQEIQKTPERKRDMENGRGTSKKQSVTKNGYGGERETESFDDKTEIKFKFNFHKKSEKKTGQYRKREVESKITVDVDSSSEARNEYREECWMGAQKQETDPVQSAGTVVNKGDSESALKADGSGSPHVASSTNVGTLGVSKSGRLRKASARGIESIEIKSLFMENNVSSAQTGTSETSEERTEEKPNSPDSLDANDDDDFVEELRIKRSRYPKDPSKLYQGVYLNRYKRMLQNDTSVISFTYKEGHLVPRFKELDYYLGDYCCEAGVNVDDINSNEKKDVDMTVGMVKELHDFYLSRGASKTALALRLLQMGSVKVLDYTQVLSTVLSISKAAKTNRLDFSQLQKEFRFPKRHFCTTYTRKKKTGEAKEKGRAIKNSYLKVSAKKKKTLFQVPEELRNAAMAEIKKKRGRPKNMTTKSQVTDYELALDVEIVRASLKLGAWNGAEDKFRISPKKKAKEEILSPKGKVGRPRKNPIQTATSSHAADVNYSVPYGGAAAMPPAAENGGPRRRGRPRKNFPQAPAGGHAEDAPFDGEITKTRGKEGSVTRGDIVYLYTQWLRNKMAVGSNVFVTDLLKDVEQLMAERKVPSIRIPAGTLMSSSVRLHDEFKQMLTVSKEDALLYLEEDWLEDIQYLVSISRSSRRSAVEGENGGSGLDRTDAEDSYSSPYAASAPAVASRDRASDSEFSERSSAADDWAASDDSVGPRGGPASRKHMESVGKRANKKRDIGYSLEEYDLEDFREERPRRRGDGRHPRAAQHARAEGSYTEEDYDVEKIVDYREVYDKKRGVKHLKYLVRWLGFGAEEDCWVDEEDLECPEILEEFWEDSRRKRGGRHSGKKNSRSGLWNRESARAFESSRDAGASDGSDKENIIEAMTELVSLKGLGRPGLKEVGEPVTRRELLDLYDGWRQENQDVLMAGGSNTVNLGSLVDRASELMASRGIKDFRAESLLNACFLMTLMRGRLKTEKALNLFLDSNCTEVLEASHKQYLVMQRNVGGKCDGRGPPNEDMTVSGLRGDLQKAQRELSAAVGSRSANRCALGALEEEVDCLERVLEGSSESSPDVATRLQQKVEILKEDLNSLRNKNGKGSGSMASNAKKSWKAKKDSNTKLPVSLTECDSDKLKEPVLEAGQELLKCGVPRHKIDCMIELVVNKVGGQIFRAQPAGVRSIAEEIGLMQA